MVAAAGRPPKQGVSRHLDLHQIQPRNSAEIPDISRYQRHEVLDGLAGDPKVLNPGSISPGTASCRQALARVLVFANPTDVGMLKPSFGRVQNALGDLMGRLRVSAMWSRACSQSARASRVQRNLKFQPRTWTGVIMPTVLPFPVSAFSISKPNTLPRRRHAALG